jgi:hypothetical protein
MMYARHSVGCHDARHHGSKNGERVVTVRIRPDAAVDKARRLVSFGWQVLITDAAGQKFDVSEFDQFLWINREGHRTTVGY